MLRILGNFCKTPPPPLIIIWRGFLLFFVVVCCSSSLLCLLSPCEAAAAPPAPAIETTSAVSSVSVAHPVANISDSSKIGDAVLLLNNNISDKCDAPSPVLNYCHHLDEDELYMARTCHSGGGGGGGGNQREEANDYEDGVNNNNNSDDDDDGDGDSVSVDRPIKMMLMKTSDAGASHLLLLSCKKLFANDGRSVECANLNMNSGISTEQPIRLQLRCQNEFDELNGADSDGRLKRHVRNRRRKRGRRRRREKASGETIKIIRVEENARVDLPCDGASSDYDEGADGPFRWRKDNKVLRLSQDQMNDSSSNDGGGGLMIRDDANRHKIDPSTGTLTINNARASNAGLYQCQSGTQKTIKLEVIELLKFSPLPPPPKKHISLGQTARIHCWANGSPSPTISWSKEGSTQLPPSVQVINGTLAFSNVSTSDAGNYSCRASNTRQGEIVAHVQVSVGRALQFAVAPPVGNVTIIDGEPLSLDCSAVGDPVPTVQWDKDLEFISNLSNSHIQIHSNGTLYIESVQLEDSGTYGCTIGNSGGLKREQLQLNVVYANEISGVGVKIEGDEPVAEDSFFITRAVVITMSVAFAYIILVVGLMVWCRRRRKMSRLQQQHQQQETNKTEEENLIESSGNKKERKVKEEVNVISDDHLVDLVQLSSTGDFGAIRLGKLKLKKKKPDSTTLKEINEIHTDENHKENGVNGLDDMELKPILAKSVDGLTLNGDDSGDDDIRKRFDAFRSIKHANVVTFYGITANKLELVCEYTDWGELKQFLIATKDLRLAQILTLAHQLAYAGDAMTRARLVHGDIAARNCLIQSNFTVKICWPSFNPDKYKREYYRQKEKWIPLRWMAPEVIVDGTKACKQSEIFAFGIVCWELFTRAKMMPFEKEIPDDEEYVKQINEATAAGNACSGAIKWSNLVDVVPNELNAVLASCWNASPKERPSFSHLYKEIGKCLQNETAKTNNTTTTSTKS